jgi:hypothetical protein
MRAASLTAGPITVKSSRPSAPTLPYCTVPTCSAMSRPSVGCPASALGREQLHEVERLARRGQRRAAGLRAPPFAQAEDRQQPVAQELQHLAAVPVHRRTMQAKQASSRAISWSPGRLSASGVKERQVGVEQHRFDALHLAAQHGAGQHARRRILAEIGLEQALADRRVVTAFTARANPAALRAAPQDGRRRSPRRDRSRPS